MRANNNSVNTNSVNSAPDFDSEFDFDITEAVESVDEKETEMTNNNTPNQDRINLDEAVKNLEMVSEFQFDMETPFGTQTVPVRIDFWDDGNPKTIFAGEVSEYTQPMKYKQTATGYEIEETINAISSIERYAMVDPDGLVLKAPIEKIEAMRNGQNLGWVLKGYAGSDIALPPFTGNYTTAWYEIVKQDGVLSYGLTAVKYTRGGEIQKRYKNKDDFKRAQIVCAEMSALTSILDGGIEIWIPAFFQRKVNYFWKLWNLQLHDPEKAAKVARQRYIEKVQKNATQKAVRKEISKQHKAEQGLIAPRPEVTAIAGQELVEGARYEVYSPANTLMFAFTYYSSDRNARAQAISAKAKVEKDYGRPWKLARVG